MSASCRLADRQPAAGPGQSCTWRSARYRRSAARLENEHRHAQQMAELHLATIEALALAIDAKDQTAHNHIGRVQIYATGAGARARHVRRRGAGGQDRGAAARHRQAGRARAHPRQARPADARGVPEGPHPPAGRRRHHRAGAVPVSGGAAHPQPPRAVGRPRLSVRAEGREHPARRAHPLPGRLLRRAHLGPAVSQADDRRSGAAQIEQEAGKALDPDGRGGVPADPA